MTIVVGIHEGKTSFPRLVSEVERTLEDVLITRHGRPVARIVPLLGDEAEAAARRDMLAAARARLVAGVQGPPISADEVREWIDSGRR